MSPARRRRLLAPEVIQTSAMDCGPAALLCLLQGHGVDVSYGRLREACQTDVDGTALTALEEVGARLGLATAQVMLPADHVLRPEAAALPALLTLRLPDGAPHFVVGWRRIGGWVQVMDPAAGRRWLSVAALEGELYRHAERVPAADWRAWAAEDAPRATWSARLAALGLSPDAVAAALERAFADPGCGGIASLDAACRATQAMVRAGALRPGPPAAAALAHLLDDPLRRVPIDDWSVQPADPDEDGAPMLELRAAVLVRVDGRAPPAPGAPPLSPELAAAVAGPDPSAITALAGLLRADGPQRPLVIMGGAVILAAGGLAQALALRAALELGPLLAGLGQRGAGLAGLALAAFGLLAVELAVQLAARGAGQALELRLRVALHEKLPRLEDRYLSSRPASDLAARAHALHAVRALPELGAQLVRALASLGAAAGGLLLLRPAAAPLVLLAVGVAAGLPLLLQAPLTELDHRWKAQSASLSRYLFDALAGRAPLRSHGAGGALRRLHEEQLVHWARTGREALTATTGAELLMGLCGALLSAALLLGWVGAPAGGGLLLAVVWALQLPALGQDLGQLARQAPGISNLVRRLVEPLGAVEDPRAAPAGAASAEDPGADLARAADRAPARRGVALRLDGVDVIAAGHTVLEGVDLVVPPGAQVAVVGESGAGKSTLLGLLLGWTGPAAGALTVDGAPLDAAGLAALRARTAWVDPAVQLWNEPLIDNLDYGAPEDAAPVGAAIAAADLHGVLEGLPDGLAELIGEGGALLSGGEGQRLRLARALRRQGADLVLLDEPFRGLARPQRAALLAAARRWWAGATLLCVSHDLVETASFDRVLVFSGGRLVEDGAPDALLAAGGEYARLMQAERAARAALAPGAGWVRRWLVDGRLEAAEDPRRSHDEDDVQRADPVPAAGGAAPADPARAAALAAGPGERRSLDEDEPQPADPGPAAGGAAPADPALAAARWPAEALPAAVAALATAVGADPVEGALPPGPPPGAAGPAVEAWLCALAAWRGAEALPVSAPPGGLDGLLARGGPALIWWGDRPQDGALVLIGARGGQVCLLGPDLRPVRLPVAALGAHLRARLPAALRAGVEQLLAAAPPAGDQAAARARLLALRGADQALAVGLLLRLPPSAPLWALLRHNGLLRGAVLIALGHAAEVGAAVGGAALLARGALVGQLAAGWLGGWALLALGAALLRGAVLWAEGAWALRLGALLRRRLLVGALHLPADQVRRAGLGQLLGTTLEAEALDALGPAGGALALFALLELGAALALLLVGAGGLPHALALVAWGLGVGVGVVFFARRRARWSAGRLRLTHRLVEALVGHRTRLAQELPARWHLREDDALCAHQAAAAPMDRAAALISALAPGGWTALGLAALGPAALAGAPPSALALGLAGVIAGAGALRKLGWGAAALIDAGVALAQVRPLLSAAAAAPRPPRPRPLPPAPLEAPLEARGLRLRHPGRARAALDGVDLQIARGDHLLLLGPSGAGKSTLAAVLAGARPPDAGLLLVGGLDPRALGPDGWRAAVGLVPQFHENHVFATTLAFNLLLGQDWPPSAAALDAAEELCEALGLGPLLRRMPGGLLQLVGETGWRLSHGEQSRVFLARGLLSGAQIVILDESVAALDPATLSRCVEVVRARAPAAVLIAHP